LIGHRPVDSNGPLIPFRLSTAGLEHPFFTIEDASTEELADLYREPLFFQAVAIDEKPAAPTSPPAPEKELKAAPPRWLLWAQNEADEPVDVKVEQESLRCQPRVLARYDNQQPFLVERRFGRGQALFVSTAIQSDWNTLTTCNAVLIFDRMMRDLLATTLPRHDFAAGEPIVLPIAPTQRTWQFRLYDSQGAEDALSVEALGERAYGIVLRGIMRRGLYKVVGLRDAADTATDWQFPLAVQGPERESELKPLGSEKLLARLADMTVQVVPTDGEISIAAVGQSASALWTWLLALAGVGLIVELGVLGWPNRRPEARP